MPGHGIRCPPAAQSANAQVGAQDHGQCEDRRVEGEVHGTRPCLLYVGLATSVRYFAWPSCVHQPDEPIVQIRVAPRGNHGRLW